MRWLAVGAVLLAGCGPRVGPSIDAVGAPSVAVGVELQLLLHGSSPDGSLSFDFSSPDLPDLKTRPHAATLTNYAAGEAVLRWTPIASDVGAHEIDVTATGNGLTSVAAVPVTVTPGAGAPPLFREPAGDGTTLDLARGPCAEIDVLVEDPDQAAVTIALAPPPLDNATVEAHGSDAALLRFCPSPEQVAASLLYPLTLTADDGAHQSLKPYTIVVRPAPDVTCTTQPPAIATQPLTDEKTTAPLHVQARLTDDVAVVGARVLWTNVPPDDPQNPDLSAFFSVEMARSSGTATNGTWDGWLPNPVVASPPGTAQTIYYVLAVADDDQPWGCGHTTLLPAPGAWSFTVTRP